MKIRKLLTAAVLGVASLMGTSIAFAAPLTLVPGGQGDFNGTPCIYTGNMGGGGGCALIVGTGTAPTNTPTGGTSTYASASYTYTVDQLITALGGDNTFNIGIDSNWANSTPNNSEFLDAFRVFFNDTAMTGAAAYEYTGGGAMDFGANGTGNENFRLNGPVDLSTLAGTDTVDFYLEMSGLTDGFEQVFLLRAGFIDPCVADPTLPGCDNGGGGNGDPCVEDPTLPGCDNGGGDNGGGDNGGGDNGGGGNGDPVGVPEPGTLLLLGTGLVGMGLGRRRRKRATIGRASAHAAS